MLYRTAAKTTGDAIAEYLHECSKNERWPDYKTVDQLFADNFAPVIRHDVEKLERELTATRARLAELEGIAESMAGVLKRLNFAHLGRIADYEQWTQNK